MRSCWLSPLPLRSMPVLGCRKTYAMQLSAIRMTVTTGKWSVGMLSRSGNTSARLRERPDARRVLGDVLVCVVGAAHERPGRDVIEAERVRRPLERLELVRVPVADHGEVALGRPQVLADGEHPAACLAQVLERRDHLVVGLAEAHHEPRLRHDLA